jgi:hypothetical protein
MEAKYYLRGTQGKGLDASDIGADPGKVVGGDKVPFKNKAVKEFLKKSPRMNLLMFAFIVKHLATAQSIVLPSTSMQGFLAAKGCRAGIEFQCIRERDEFPPRGHVV